MKQEPSPKSCRAPRHLSADLPFERDSYAATIHADIVDRSLHATIARGTGGLSPSALALAYWDWMSHLLMSPGKQAQLVDKAAKKGLKLSRFVTRCTLPDNRPCIEPLPQDRRFRHPTWQTWPYNAIYQAFLLNQQWWHNATTGIRGVSPHHERMVEFASRQILDVFSPSNFLATNPELLGQTWEEGGGNLVRGAQNFLEDLERARNGKGVPEADAYVVGEDVAATPGKVIYANRLIELIQYEPATDKVRPEPVLFVPAWIMKYYILDLGRQNSMVDALRRKGFSVFMISWKNPAPEDRDLGLDDYLDLGVMAALDAIGAVRPDCKVHAAGYCLGGTLLTIAAAAMARDGDKRLASFSLLAAQADFSEVGEIALFIDESQVSFLEDVMWEQGYLESRHMTGAFQLLRSNDLIWSRMVGEYLRGERPQADELVAWNADATRMPYRMHSEYLRQFFLNNDLAEGRYRVGDRPVAVSDIRVPMFVVATEWDHVAPWRSVYKYHLLTDTRISFLLASGGHNRGIVAPPGTTDPRYHYRVATRAADDRYIAPDQWLQMAARHEGSWWPEWTTWLARYSGERVAPPAMGAAAAGYAPRADAPGRYVRET